MRVAVLDYDAGNVFNLMSALEYIGMESFLTNDEKKLDDSSAIFIPGVGAFGDASQNLRKYDLFDVIRRQHQKGKWIVGICLGMQILFDKGFEDGENDGLGLLKGQIRPILTSNKLPHMGWNELVVKKNEDPISNLDRGSHVYFVHSYCAFPEDEAMVIASCEYGMDIPAIVKGEGVLGLQFHPEKSGRTGLKILKNIKEMLI
jgi:imidazole glycerol-phosphate synthase subunit HisH